MEHHLLQDEMSAIRIITEHLPGDIDSVIALDHAWAIVFSGTGCVLMRTKGKDITVEIRILQMAQ
ncbi:hypothetical protein D3C75_1228670 [compost metagenome]